MVNPLSKLSNGYIGYLDGIAGVEFGQWMLTEGDQIIMGSQTIDSLSAAAANITTINSIDIKRLMAEAVHISDNATIDEATFRKHSVTFYNLFFRNNIYVPL